MQSDTNKRLKPGTFHEVFFKTGIGPRGISRVTSKPNQSVVTFQDNA